MLGYIFTTIKLRKISWESHVIRTGITKNACKNLNGKSQRKIPFGRHKFMWRPVTVAERSKVCTVFAISEGVIMGSNPTQGIEIGCVCVFLCLRCPVFRQRPCDGPVTRSRSPTVCEMIKRTKEKPRHPYKGIRETDEKKSLCGMVRKIYRRKKE
jgi:hypothetical protein